IGHGARNLGPRQPPHDRALRGGPPGGEGASGDDARRLGGHPRRIRPHRREEGAMARSDLPDRETFVIGRTVPMKKPDRRWLEAVLERVLARYRSLLTLDKRFGHPGKWTEYNQTSSNVSFWLLPAAPLGMWLPSYPDNVRSGCQGRFPKAKLD